MFSSKPGAFLEEITVLVDRSLEEFKEMERELEQRLSGTSSLEVGWANGSGPDGAGVLRWAGRFCVVGGCLRAHGKAFIKKAVGKNAWLAPKVRELVEKKAGAQALCTHVSRKLYSS